MTDGRLSYAVSYPTQRGWGHLLKLGGVLLASILIVPYFMLVGYFFRALETVMDGAESPPPLGEWKALLIEGLRATGAMLIISLPSYAVYALMVAGEATALQAVFGLIYVVTLYLMPMVMMRYAVTRNWRETYTADLVRDTLNVEYLAAAVLAVALFFGVYLVLAIVTAVSVITIVGPIIVVLAGSSYIYLMYAAYWGRYYRGLGQ